MPTLYSAAVRRRVPGVLRGVALSLVVLVIARVPVATGQAAAPPVSWELPPNPLSRPGIITPKQRRELAKQRIELERSGDLVGVATINARLVADAIERSVVIHDVWMTRRNPTTGLFPESPNRPWWNYRNTAADFFCYQFIIALDTGAASVPALRETLARERAFNSPASPPSPGRPGLCDSIDITTGGLIPQTPRERLFGTSEYVKDGLLPLYERHAEPATLERMMELADAIIETSAVQSRFGKIPSRDCEINGNVLQAFSRLGFFAGSDGAGKRFHDMAGRLADAVVQQMLAHTGGVPVHFYDYSTDRFPSGRVKLRDHGNETAVGLSEAFATAVALKNDPEWAARADRWAEPLTRMYELILQYGVNSDGLIVSSIDAKNGRTSTPGASSAALEIFNAEPCDNWGYLLSGAILFTQAAERHGVISRARLDGILASIDRVALAVTKTDGLRWEGDNPDGFADTVESALYIAAHRPTVRRRLLEWADDQISYMYGYQRENGFVTDGYLDGNMIRTSIQYADMRSGECSLSPHVPGAAIGLAAAEGKEPVLVVLAGPAGCHATLEVRRDAHASVPRLPWEWPRINSWPRWGMAQPAGGTGGSPAASLRIDLEPNQSKVIRPAEIGLRPVGLP